MSEAITDAERLDWLEKHAAVVKIDRGYRGRTTAIVEYRGPRNGLLEENSGATLREAIDQAIEAEP